MSFNKFAFGLAMLSAASWVNAVAVDPIDLPVEEGGLFAVAAVCLAIGIRIARSKRDR